MAARCVFILLIFLPNILQLYFSVVTDVNPQNSLFDSVYLSVKKHANLGSLLSRLFCNDGSGETNCSFSKSSGIVCVG